MELFNVNAYHFNKNNILIIIKINWLLTHILYKPLPVCLLLAREIFWQNIRGDFPKLTFSCYWATELINFNSNFAFIINNSWCMICCKYSIEVIFEFIHIYFFNRAYGAEIIITYNNETIGVFNFYLFAYRLYMY